VKLVSDSQALTNSLIQAKFNDTSRHRPTEEGGDAKRGDRSGRHDKEDAALHASHISGGLGELAVGLLVNAVDQN
jgi:hypothetical protein